MEWDLSENDRAAYIAGEDVPGVGLLFEITTGKKIPDENIAAYNAERSPIVREHALEDLELVIKHLDHTMLQAELDKIVADHAAAVADAQAAIDHITPGEEE